MLQAYFLTRHIAEPTLIIAKRRPGVVHPPLPGHARVRLVSYRDVAFVSTLGEPFLRDGAGRLRLLVRALLKLQELVFFAKSLPALVRFRPEIVHTHGLITLPPGLFAKWVLGARLVVSIHNVTEALLVRRLGLLRRALRAADRVVCVSDAIRRELPGVDAAKLEVIPTAMDPEIFGPQDVQRKHQLVAVGYFKWQKGYAHLIRAMAEVVAARPDYRLLIAGDGPERPAIETLVDELGLRDHVRLLGILPQREVARHLGESTLFVMSSLVEGLPKALLEAMACGTPAVVTTACNAEAFIDRVGVAVEPGDSRALAKAVLELLDDDERRQRLSGDCVAVAQEYSWKKVADRVRELYRRLEARR